MVSRGLRPGRLSRDLAHASRFVCYSSIFRGVLNCLAGGCRGGTATRPLRPAPIGQQPCSGCRQPHVIKTVPIRVIGEHGGFCQRLPQVVQDATAKNQSVSRLIPITQSDRARCGGAGVLSRLNCLSGIRRRWCLWPCLFWCGTVRRTAWQCQQPVTPFIVLPVYWFTGFTGRSTSSSPAWQRCQVGIWNRPLRRHLAFIDQ